MAIWKRLKLTDKKRPLWLAGVFLIITLAAGLVIAKKLTHPSQVSHNNDSLAAYRTKVDFVLFAPTSMAFSQQGTTNIKLNSQSHIISYSADYEKTRITITMQATPEGFVDVPQAYDKLIEKMNGYSEFDSLSGKVHLTRPVELKGGQTAVMNSKGTLLFAKPASDLTDAQWRKFFNQLDVVK